MIRQQINTIVSIFFFIPFLTFYSCSYLNESTNGKFENEGKEKKSSLKIIKNKDCIKCDSIYLAFPKNLNSFDKYYGYPNGLRLNYGQEDFVKLFSCLNFCFNHLDLNNAVKLSAELDFSADGPTYLQYNLTQYLKENKSKAIKIYSGMECNKYLSHVDFLFDGIPKEDSFYSELCKYIISTNSKLSCDVIGYCEK